MTQWVFWMLFGAGAGHLLPAHLFQTSVRWPESKGSSGIGCGITIHLLRAALCCLIVMPNKEWKSLWASSKRKSQKQKTKKNHRRAFTLIWEHQEWWQAHGFGINLRLASHSLGYLFCLCEPQISLRVQLALPVYQGCCEDKNENIYVNICGVSGRHKEACLTPSVNFSEEKEFSYYGRHD